MRTLPLTSEKPSVSGNVSTASGRFAIIGADEVDMSGSSVIGEGAESRVLGVTYAGRAAAFKKRLALTGNIEAVLREARNHAAISHDNVVSLLGVVVEPRSAGLLMQMCEGGVLSWLLRQLDGVQCTQRLIVNWALQIVRGMEAVATKLVHCDLKADNVLILQKPCLCFIEEQETADVIYHSCDSEEEECVKCGRTPLEHLQLKISDFGLSRKLGEHASSSSATGTPYAMAPEIVKNGHYSEYSDVWAFGVLLWHLVTRELPYGQLHSDPALHFHVASNKAKLPFANNFPKQLAAITKRCLLYNHTKRPTFNAIKRDLEKYYKKLLGSPRKEYIHTTKPRPRRRLFSLFPSSTSSSSSESSSPTDPSVTSEVNVLEKTSMHYSKHNHREYRPTDAIPGPYHRLQRMLEYIIYRPEEAPRSPVQLDEVVRKSAKIQYMKLPEGQSPANVEIAAERSEQDEEEEIEPDPGYLLLRSPSKEE